MAMHSFVRQINLISVLLYLILRLLQVTNSSDVHLWGELTNFERARLVNCTVKTYETGYYKSTLFNLKNESAFLVSASLGKKDCKVGSPELGSCSFGEQSMSVHLLISDMKEGEYRTYGCTAKRYIKDVKSETHFINLTLPYETTTAAIESTSTSLTTEVTQEASSPPTTVLDEGTSIEAYDVTGAQTCSPGVTRDTQSFHIVSIVLGAGVTFVVMTTVLVITVVYLRCHTAKHTQIESLGVYRFEGNMEPSRSAGERQAHCIEEHPENAPPTDEPAGASCANCPVDSSMYLTPVHKPTLEPPPLPKRHRFHRVATHDSGGYEVVP